MDKLDMVNNPPHYNAYSIEVIEVTRHCSFNIGNAIKYMLRHPHKGSSRQDLEKAMWYVTDQINSLTYSKLIQLDSIANKLITLAREYLQQPGANEYVSQALLEIALDDLHKAKVSLARALEQHPAE